MRRAWTLFPLAMLGGFAGCQAVSDDTDYSSPVAVTEPAEYAGAPIYTGAVPVPQDAVVVPQESAPTDSAIPPGTGGGSGSY